MRDTICRQPHPGFNSTIPAQHQIATGIAAADVRPPASRAPSRWAALPWIAVSIGAFCAAYSTPYTGPLILLYLFGLLRLARLPTWRQAFYSGLTTGFGIAALQLSFFWTIFSAGAIALWLVFAFWIGAFTALARLSLNAGEPLVTGNLFQTHRWRLGAMPLNPGWILVPVIWCGLEYFRCELYYLRFAWLTAGFALPPASTLLPGLGIYGLGFLLISLACLAASFWPERRKWGLGILTGSMLAIHWMGQVQGPQRPEPTASSVEVAGIQLEFPTEKQVLVHLNELRRQFPEAQLLVLSEYTFTEPLPDRVRTWCRDQHRYLIVGAKEPIAGGGFYNTAFVVSPDGQIVFRQAKSVPIQFFNDGRPAPRQEVWESPWGKIGVCICYDLSYRRVTDHLIEQGAQALIVPTMDVADWGLRQHALHARVAPIRAAEYGVPIFRLASSGISQLVDGHGRIVASAPALADGAVIHGKLALATPGRHPIDRWLAPASTLATLCACLLFLVRHWLRPRSRSNVES